MIIAYYYHFFAKMNIVIDPSAFFAFLNQPADVLLSKFLFYFGWLPLAITFLWGSFKLWIFYRQNQWFAKNAKFTLLAIDIPRGNEQSPRAVENLFTYLGGAHGSINLIEKYWLGMFQLGFSFEIVSIGGYTQFIIQTPINYRNLVESAVYSQYPDAEITEVDDYTNQFKGLRFPNDKYDIFGAEFIQAKSSAYPIKTYEEFEHQMGEPETHFKDPMASLMDLCSSMRPGENFWYQMLVIPTGFDWVDELDKEVAKILGEKPKFTKNILHHSADAALGAINAMGNAVFTATEPTVKKKEEKKDESLKMMNLKPKQKKRVEAIEEKSAKLGFNFKIRVVYIAEKELFSKVKAFGGFVGFIKQFAALDLNNLKPDMDKTATSASYLFKNSNLRAKKNRIFRNYVNRSVSAGRKPGLMNIEELATIWHFPNEGVVKAPMIQKAPGRKAEPPMTLPQTEASVSEEKAEPLFLGELEEEFSPSDTGLPFIEDDNETAAAKPSEEKEETKTNEPKEEKKDEIFAEESLPVTDKGAPPENLPFI
jgi:hypothetical protein